jgi:hypothetical protein
MNPLDKPILAIDPGNQLSAYCVYFPDTHTLGDFGKVPNDELRKILKSRMDWDHHYAVEMVASYGMAVGKSVFDTCVWIGRYMQIIEHRGKEPELIYRQEVKRTLCNGNMRAKDSNIRQAIIDRFPATGGGKNPTVGIKANPGPLFGVSADVWAALGVALTYHAKLVQDVGSAAA